jgi:hypothetical protein
MARELLHAPETPADLRDFARGAGTAVAAQRASLICLSSSLISRSSPALRSSAHASSLLASASKKAALR